MHKRHFALTYEPKHEKTCFCICENKGAKPISTYVFATCNLLIENNTDKEIVAAATNHLAFTLSVLKNNRGNRLDDKWKMCCVCSLRLLLA